MGTGSPDWIVIWKCEHINAVYNLWFELNAISNVNDDIKLDNISDLLSPNKQFKTR